MNQPNEDYDKEFLRENWRFSTILYFLELFGFACPHPIPSLTPNVLEDALLEVIKRDPKKGTKKETSKNSKTTTVSLEDIFVALLRGMYPKKDLSKDQWETVLRNKMKHDYKYFQNFLDLSLYEQSPEQTTTTMTDTATDTTTTTTPSPSPSPSPSPTAQSNLSEISNANSNLSNSSASTHVEDPIIQDSNNSNSNAQEITLKTSTTNKTENANNKSNGNNENTNPNKNMQSNITQVSQNTMADTTEDYGLLSTLGTRNNSNTTLEKSTAAKKEIHNNKNNSNEESDSDYINDSNDDEQEQEQEQEDGNVESDESETLNKKKRKKATIESNFYRRSDRLNPRGKKEELKEKKSKVQESESEDDEENGKSKTKNSNGKFSHPLFTLPITSLPFSIKVLILQFLCESQIDLNDDIKKIIEIRNSEGIVGAKTLRKEEYAIDGRGMIYWFFGGNDDLRLCREHQKSVHGDLFQTVATDHESLEKFMETLSSSKNKKDIDLVEKLQQNIIQPHNARLQAREAAAKRLKRLSINPGNILTSTSRTSARERPRPNYSNFFAENDDRE